MALQAALGGPRHCAYLTPPPSAAGFSATFAPEVQKSVGFLHISENVDFDTPYIFLFLWFSLSLLRARRRGRILEATPFRRLFFIHVSLHGLFLYSKCKTGIGLALL